MVTEAGGIVGEFNGESDYLYKGDIIAASPKIFGQMVGLLTPFHALRQHQPPISLRAGQPCPAVFKRKASKAFALFLFPH
jgi:hypothetical protein